MNQHPDRSQAPAILPNPPIVFPHVHTQILPNGVTVHYLDTPGQEISTVTILRTGGRLDAPTASLPLFLSHALRNGHSEMDSEAMADLLDFNGVETDAVISSHYTGLSMTGLPENIIRILPDITRCHFDPLLPEQVLDSLTGQALTLLDMNRKKPLWWASNDAMLMLMGNPQAPLARVETAADIRAINRPKLLDFHLSTMNPAGTHILLSGHVTDELLDCVTRLWSHFTLPENVAPVYKNIVPVPLTVKRAMRERPLEGSLQSAVSMVAPMPGRDSEDYHMLRFTITALGGYFGSRLMQNIREKKGLTYGIDSSLLGMHEGAFINITAQFNADARTTVLEEIDAEIRNLAVNPPSGAELQQLKAHLGAALLKCVDGPGAVMETHFSPWKVGTPPDYYRRQQQALQSLNSDSISEMAAKYLVTANFLTAVCQPC